MSRLFFLTLLLGTVVGLQASPIPFPAGFIPFSSIDYVTAPVQNGDRLVLGNGSLNTLIGINAIPFPSSSGQIFASSSIELAPGQVFSNVYVPTPADRSGAYPEFAGLLIDPVTGQPFSGGIIPSSLLFGYYAFRLAPGATTPTPEPASWALLVTGVSIFFLSKLRLARKAKI